MEYIYITSQAQLKQWDPDFVKTTPEEKERMDAADEELREGVYFTEAEVWEEQ